VLDAFPDRENVRLIGGNVIVDNDPAIDRNAGARGHFGIRLDADRGRNRVGR